MVVVVKEVDVDMDMVCGFGALRFRSHPPCLPSLGLFSSHAHTPTRPRVQPRESLQGPGKTGATRKEEGKTHPQTRDVKISSDLALKLQR